MRNLILSTSISVLLTGCLTTHGLDKMVEHKISKQLITTNLLDTSHFVLKTDHLQSFEAPSSSQIQSSFFIPAIVYWGWENTLKCKVNNHYFINLFTDILNRKMKEAEWKDKLNDKKLEITIDSLPNQFIYSSKGMMIFLFTAYSYSFSKVIQPENQEFRISYRLLQNSKALKQGSFWTKYTRPEYPRNQSENQFVEHFLDIQKDFFITESDNLIQQICKDL